MIKKCSICFLLVVVIISITSFDYKKKSREVIYQGNRYLVSVDGEKVLRFPDSGRYYLVNYDCNNKNTVVTWNMDTYEVSVSNGSKKGGVSCYLDFESSPKLSSMKAGSYVKYVGNNGCSGDSCLGKNANYINSDHLGYCNSQNLQYYSDGYRIAYSKDDTAYLVSAGSPECVCTSSDGGVNKSCNTSLTVNSNKSHIQNLDNVALKYCNTEFVYGGICNKDSVWNINDSDFNIMINKKNSIDSCVEVQNGKCGYFNDLVDVGGYYWYSYDNSNGIFNWDASFRFVDEGVSSLSLGVRPIIRIDSNVVVIGGDGTYKNPYIISNYAFNVGNQDYEKRTLSLEMIGFNVKSMCVNLNSTVCTQYVPFETNYVLDIGNAFDGENVVYVYYKDTNDNVIAVINRKFVLK